MTNPFDPYREWLGIEPQQGGAAIDHYRLLGLMRFESDAARIAAAADERMALVRRFQVGPRAIHTQKLLNELSAAKLCLLSPSSKAAYDARLRTAGVPPASPPTAPPIEPPEPPEQRVTFAVSGDEPPETIEIAPPAPWWRPIAAMLAAALAVLAGVAAWGIVQTQWPRPTPVASAPAQPPPAPEPEPEPPPPEPIVQFQEASGEVNLAPGTAVVHGEVELRTAGRSEVLAGFDSPEAEAQWHFRLIEPGFFQLELTYATAADVADARLEAAIGEDSKTCELRSTSGLDQFLTDSYTVAVPKSGQHTLVLRPAHTMNGDWLALKSVRLVPVGREAPPLLTP
jgi:hypothetical protein